jgi:alpha-2-macroglobulin
MKTRIRKSTLLSLLFCLMFTGPALLFYIPLANTPDAMAQEKTAESAASPGGFGITGVWPLPGERVTNRFILYFNEPLQPVNGFAPVHTDPVLEGRWETGDYYIEYILENPKPPAHAFRATLDPQLRSISGRAPRPDRNEARFIVKDISVQKPGFIEKKEGRTTVEIRFSAPMDAESVRSALTVHDAAGNPVGWALEAGSGMADFRLAFPEDTALPLHIRIAETASAASGLLRLPAAAHWTWPEKRDSLLKSADWKKRPAGKDEVWVHLHHPVSVEQLTKKLALSNADTGEEIPFLIRESNPDDDHLVIPEAENLTGIARIMVVIDRGAFTENGVMLTRAENTIITPDTQELRLIWKNWREEGVDGPVLSLRFNANVDAGELKKHLRIEPPAGEIRVEGQSHNRYNIHAAWQTGNRYRIVLREGLTGLDGSHRLKNERSVPLDKVPEVSGLAFGYAEKLYFPRQTAGPLPLEARNKKEAAVSLHRLFPNNVTRAVDHTRNPGTGAHFNTAFTEKIAETTIALPDKKDTKITVPFDVRKLLPADRKGIFSLQLENENNWRNTKIIVWTDIGVLAHWKADELVLFAHDLFSLEPLNLARITVYSSKNQVLAEANTGPDGIAVLHNLNTGLGTPDTVVIESGNDFTFLDLNAREQDAVGWREDMPLFDTEGYDAFIYADRALYRPGETVHARWITRKNSGGPLSGTPLAIKVRNPKDTVVLNDTTTPDEAGCGGLDIATGKAWLTGRYLLEVAVPGADKPISRYEFHLEEFVPNRLRAETTVPAPYWLAGRKEAFRIKAAHLFGAPAANRKATAAVILRKGEFAHPDWDGYHFSSDEEFKPEVRELGEFKTDENGAVDVEFTCVPEEEMTSPLLATARGSVLETGGRAVSDTQDIMLFPSKRDAATGEMKPLPVPGISITTDETAPGEIELHAAAIYPDGAAAPLDSLEVLVEEEHWTWNVRRFQDHNAPYWNKYFEVEQKHKVPLKNGKGTINVQLHGYGYYRIRVRSDATPLESAVKFYRYWRRIEEVSTPRPSLIKVTTDRASCKTGDQVELRIESPFDGRAVVVLQGGAFHDVMTTPVTESLGTVRFTATRDFCPNLWAEVTVIRTMDPEAPAVYPFSSFAAVNVPVIDPARRLQVGFESLPAEIRPQETLSFTVETRDHTGAPAAAKVTVAAVDEGIHNILGYDTPDPAAWFSRTRRPVYNRAHYYDRVAWDFESPAPGGGLLAKRLGEDQSMVGENWIKPVALWSGVVETGEDGRAKVIFNLPEFNGQLRIAAVAATAGAAGANAENIHVRSPYMLRESLPRFVLPEDRFICQATLFNTTDAPCSAEIGWVGEGTVSTDAPGETVTINADSETHISAAFQAAERHGPGAVVIRAVIRDANGAVAENIEKRLPLPVRYPAIWRRIGEISVVEPGESRDFSNTQFLENNRLESGITVSSRPVIQLRDALEWVTGYPYGCVEQITSKCMPLYLLRSHAALFDSALPDISQFDVWLDAGIDRLLAMQTANGGLAYWPGGSRVYDYGSVYACHFLTLAHRDRALEVPEKPFRALQEYVREIMKNTEQRDKSGFFLRACAVYVLALDGDSEALDQIAAFDEIMLPSSARYLLAAALALNTGDPQRVRQYLDTAPHSGWNERLRYGVLNSEIRNTAIELLCLTHMGETGPESRERLAVLMRYLREGHRRVTQEVSFVITAAASYFNLISAGIDFAEAEITGPEGAARIEGGGIYESSGDGAGKSWTVKNTGSAPVFVHFTTAGIPEEPVTSAVANSIAVSRTYYTSAGEVHENNRYEHGAIYFAELRLSCDAKYENILIADMLPAGFEIENPRLDPDAAAGIFEEEAATPEYLEIRDDRLVVSFDKLEKGTHRFRYALRAVSPGTFRHPAVTAECMYEPEINGASAAGTIKISDGQ